MFTQIDSMNPHQLFKTHHSVRRGFIIAFILLAFSFRVLAGDQAPILRTSGYSPVYMQGTDPVVIDPYLELYSPDGDPITNASVEVSENYRSAEDVLLYTNPVSGISDSF